MNDIIANMGETVFAVVSVLAIFLFFMLNAAVRKSQAKAYLKSHPIKKCPFCAEIVKLEAKVCKHCGRDFPPENSQPVTVETPQPPKDSTIEEYERWKKSQGL